LTVQEAPGEVTTTTLTVVLGVIEAGRLAMSTANADGAGVGVAAAWLAVGAAVGAGVGGPRVPETAIDGSGAADAWEPVEVALGDIEEGMPADPETAPDPEAAAPMSVVVAGPLAAPPVSVLS
jgi:hypothetical protein